MEKVEPNNNNLLELKNKISRSRDAKPKEEENTNNPSKKKIVMMIKDLVYLLFFPLQVPQL